MAHHFGRDPLQVGQVYQMQRGENRGRLSDFPHYTVIVRTVEVSGDGYIRVGVSFKQPHSDQWETEVGCWTFPNSLRTLHV